MAACPSSSASPPCFCALGTFAKESAYHRLHHHHHPQVPAPVSSLALAPAAHHHCIVRVTSPHSPSPRGSPQSRVHESRDISSPTSWEFRSKQSVHSLKSSSNMLRSPPPPPAPPSHLHLSLPLTAHPKVGGAGGSTSSGTTPSSLSTTPSPLEEQFASPTTDQLSYYHAIHFGAMTPSALGGGAATACPCEGVNNVTVFLDACEAGGSGVQDPLDLSEGSRTSTGSSHRSQDSGFSDAGETRKERRVQSLVAYPEPAAPSHSPVMEEQVNSQIYESLLGPSAPGGVMPSPIPNSGFGCGRFPLRPASVDISLLQSHHHHPSTPAPCPPPCIDCLSCSVRIPTPPPPPDTTPLVRLPLGSFRQRRSFSPSALASSSTQTALAALRVPLSSSTPKRGNTLPAVTSTAPSNLSNSGSSNSRLLNNRINNFESLNKNLNKDNNNNSGSHGNGGSLLNGKANKTYTLASAGLMSPPSSGASTNGTVLNEDRGSTSGDRERALPMQKKRSAAESIYDKICHRLSSFSTINSTPSVLSPAAPLQTNPGGGSVSVSKTTPASSHPPSNLEGSSPPSLSSTSALPSKFRPFIRSGSAKWQSLPRGIGVPPPEVPLKANTSAPSGIHYRFVEEEATYHEERPIDVPSVFVSSPPPRLPVRPAVPPASPVTRLLPTPGEMPVVRLWLKDLRTQYEPECLHSLQNKWILPLDDEDDEEPFLPGDQDDAEGEADSSPHPPPTTSPSSCLTCPSSRKISSCSSTGTTCSSGTASSLPPTAATAASWTSSSSGSYLRRGGHREERRSQQRFLSSMTAAIHAVSTPLLSIRTVEMTANVISAEFSKICKHLEFGVFTQVPTLVMSLTGHIQDFLRGIQTPSPYALASPILVEEGHGSCVLGPSVFGEGHLKKLEGRLEDACFALSMAVKGILRGGGDCPGDSSGASSSSALLEGEQYQQGIADVVEGIVTVGNLFSEVVDLRLTRDLGSILDTIESGCSIPARIALKSLVTVLADGGNHICRLAADIRTVRGLLGVMLDTREDQDRMLALRCLATVLCVGEAVKDFDKAGGFEIIADLLNDPNSPLWLKLEAVGVLTQATDPWIDLESTLVTLGVHLEKFIQSLTHLIQQVQTDEEPFLLVAAAISNLTFLEVAATAHLKRYHTVSHLISAVRPAPPKPPTLSVFVMDHVATILANMAGVESCRQEILQSGGINCLLHFLQQRPSPSPTKSTSSKPSPSTPPSSLSAITACERLQQKSTIALSRLANEPGVARYVFQMGGIHRLIQLCRQEKERNYSDGVLIAALATLRKLVTTLGGAPALLQEALQGAEDLLEPRLLDSFLLYSSRQESYV